MIPGKLAVLPVVGTTLSGASASGPIVRPGDDPSSARDVAVRGAGGVVEVQV
jgi:hypothetical protein